MTIFQLKKFIKQEYQRMHDNWCDDKKRFTLLGTLKLSEEVGEVCEEVLGFSCKQRKEKMRKLNKNKIAEEIADVIGVSLLLSENLEIDIWKALDKKIKKVEKRWRWK